MLERGMKEVNDKLEKVDSTLELKVEFNEIEKLQDYIF